MSGGGLFRAWWEPVLVALVIAAVILSVELLLTSDAAGDLMLSVWPRAT